MTAAKIPPSMLWPGHLAVWALAAFSARLSRVGAQIEVHITGMQGAELAPDHLRQILTAPSTEFKLISVAGAFAAVALAAALLGGSPRALGRITLLIAGFGLAIVAAGYCH